MRIGAITHQGCTITVRVSSEDVTELHLRLQDHEATSLVTGLLLALAEVDPLRWQASQEFVREEMRRLHARA
jgi:hypothetical protein